MIEEAVSGQVVLQTVKTGNAPDLFHSQLQFSQNARWLLSNGWVWHPYTVQAVYDLQRNPVPGGSIEDAAWEMTVPEKGPPDETGASVDRNLTELLNSCIHGLPGREMLLASDDEGVLWTWNLNGAGPPSSVHVGVTGELLPCGSGRVLALHTHPRLLDTDSGQVLAEWPDLNTGQNTGPLWGQLQPAVAVHPEGTAFAVLLGETLHLIDLQKNAP